MKNKIIIFSFFLLICCNHQISLQGIWVRVDDDLEGMQIEIAKNNSSYSAKIIRLAENNSILPFAIGDIKWKNIKFTGENRYEFEDLYKAVFVGSSEIETKYVYSYLSINNDTIRSRCFAKGDEIVGTSQIWIREDNKKTENY